MAVAALMAVGHRTMEAAAGQTAVTLEPLASARVVDPTSKEQVPLVIRVTGVQARPRIALFRSPTRCAQRGWRGQAVGTLTPRRGGTKQGAQPGGARRTGLAPPQDPPGLDGRRTRSVVWLDN